MPKVHHEIHLELVLKGTFVRDLIRLIEKSAASGLLEAKPSSDATKPILREADPILVGVKEAAAIIGIGRTALYKLLGEGKLKAIRIGRRNLIPIEELKALVERRLQ